MNSLSICKNGNSFYLYEGISENRIALFLTVKSNGQIYLYLEEDMKANNAENVVICLENVGIDVVYIERWRMFGNSALTDTMELRGWSRAFEPVWQDGSGNVLWKFETCVTKPLTSS